jgi:uncharacterized protein YecE (DUF72 family)
MARFYIGPAGWSYEDWEGVVYPLRKGPGFHPLTFLASYVNFIEVNSTFYRPPTVVMSLAWIRRLAGSPEFLLAVKLHQVFTHDRQNFSQKDVDEFKFGLEPLRAKERLAAILVQFPWSFYLNSANLDYLVNLFQIFADYPLAVEVRHASWSREEFFSLLREYRVAFCNIDQPVINRSLKPTAISTRPDFSYVRLHGRNYRDWFREEAGRDDRYNYFYSQDELNEWVDRIKKLAENTERVYIITNNHYRGQALANALQLRNLLTGEKLEVPPLLLEKYPVLAEIARQVSSGPAALFREKKEETKSQGKEKTKEVE